MFKTNANYKVEGPRGVGLTNYTMEDFEGSVYNLIVDLFNLYWGYHYSVGRSFGLNLPMEKNIAPIIKQGIGIYNLGVYKKFGLTNMLGLGALILQAIIGNKQALNKLGELDHGYSSTGVVLLFGIVFHCFMVLNSVVGNRFRNLEVGKEFRLFWGYSVVSRTTKSIPGCVVINLARVFNRKIFFIMSNNQGVVDAIINKNKRLKFISGQFVWDDLNLLGELLKFIRGLDLLFSSYVVDYKRSFKTYLKVCDALVEADIIGKVILLFVPVFDISGVVVMSSHEKRYYFLHYFLPAFDLPYMLVYKLVEISNRNAFGLVNKLMKLGYITDLGLARAEMQKMLDALKCGDFNMVVEVKSLSLPMISRSYMGEPLKNGVKHDNY